MAGSSLLRGSAVLLVVGLVGFVSMREVVRSAQARTGALLRRTESVEIASVNPGAGVRPELCLNASAGSAASYVCGELRLAHALPTTTTMGQARTPILVYSSEHASPYPIVRADVRRDYGPSGTPDSVTAQLWVEVSSTPVLKATGRFSGSGWSNGATRRLGVGFDGNDLSTGLYPYELEVTFWHGGSPSTDSSVGDLAIVNRKDSPFGVGWWVAGLEQLIDAGSYWLVVGGDGSVRKYTSAGSGVWAAPSVTQPDTLKEVGAEYVRFMPGGTEVVFNSSGKHVRTVNRLGQVTEFFHGSKLDSIQLPVLSGTEPCYRFVYTGDTLTSVTAPYEASGSLGCGGSSRRTVTVSHSNRKITGIEDPDEEVVAFGYSGNRVTTRTDRRGVSTAFTYGTAYRLDQVQVDTGALELTTQFVPAETRAVWTLGSSPVAPLELASVRTAIDGSRAGAADSTVFWIDRFGAPTRIRNALGDSTVLYRANGTLPALVTGVRHPNGFEEATFHNGRGNPDSVKALDPYGDAEDAVTRYTYGDANWPDFPTVVMSPEGNGVAYGYDASTGNVLWQRPATLPTPPPPPVPSNFDAEHDYNWCPWLKIDLSWTAGGGSKVIQMSEDYENWTTLATVSSGQSYYEHIVEGEEWTGYAYRIRFEAVDGGPWDNWAYAGPEIYCGP